MTPIRELLRKLNQCDYVIGLIDGLDRLYYERCVSEDGKTHESLWPTNTHKKWRFRPDNWELDQSIMSGVKLTDDDGIRVCELMRKILVPPNWFIEGELWDAAGRPRGKAQEVFRVRCERQIVLRHLLLEATAPLSVQELVELLAVEWATPRRVVSYLTTLPDVRKTGTKYEISKPGYNPS